jgi:uncharacterized protein
MNGVTGTISQTALDKEERLKKLLAGYGSLAIAYSGGVDSTYLAAVAHEVLGAGARMILADSPSMPRSELAEATAIARERQWNLVIIATQEFEDEAFLRNDARRCYLCKTELFKRMRAYAGANGIAAIAYGETADDAFDPTRIGKLAAREQAAVAPLQEAGLRKEEIRLLSRRRNLSTWNKASFACLASRIPAGSPLNLSDLARIERAEEILKGLGFRQYRARHHGPLCRIEVDPADFPGMLDPEVRTRIVDEMTALGYRYVTLDLAGYRAGGTAAPTTESDK